MIDIALFLTKFPNQIRRNANGLTNKPVHNPSYFPEFTLKFLHSGILFNSTPFFSYNLIVSLFVGLHSIFSVNV